jgi:hypothetical protein
MSKESEIYLGGGNNIMMAKSQLVKCQEILTLMTPADGAIQLNVNIEADFDTIPEKYHEVFLNMVSSKYLKTTSFGDNPFSMCLPTPKKKWYQFWKKVNY